MTDWHDSAAAAFDAVAVPLAGSRFAVADILGIHPSTYGNAVRGRRDGTRAAVTWCQRWAETRPERIRLEYDTAMGWRAAVSGDTNSAPPRRTGEGQREET